VSLSGKPSGRAKPGAALRKRILASPPGPSSNPVSKGWKRVLSVPSFIAGSPYMRNGRKPFGCARPPKAVSQISGVGLFGVFLLLVPGKFLAGLLVNDLHGEPHLAALVEAHQLDPHLVAFLDDIGGLLDALRRELRDVDEAVLGAEEVDEGAEVGGLDDRTLVDLADFRLGNDGVDPLLRRFDLLGVGRSDLDRAVILDVDLRTGLFDDLADHLAAGADHVADLVGRNVHHLDARRELAELRTGAGQGLAHLAENVLAA